MSNRNQDHRRPPAPLRRATGWLAAVLALAALLSSCSRPPPGNPPPAPVTVCGTRLCAGGTPWSMYGASVYNPGLTPYVSGIKNPSGTVALAQHARLNTVRLINFYSDRGNPATTPYDPGAWNQVDAMIAALRRAGMRADLGLADYRNLLWNNCINPYTADWSRFLSVVANRVNTVTGVTYKNDPTIAFVSVAGEPLPVGTHSFTASATGQPCTIRYSTQDLTNFYRSTTGVWKRERASVLINSGGLGYLNETTSGIDWVTIFSLPTNDLCDIKTYGGMYSWAGNAAAFCRLIGKPIIDEEFGWQQGIGDAQRSQLFDQTYALVRSLRLAGVAFWNLGYQLAPTSYEVNPLTPATLAAVQRSAP